MLKIISQIWDINCLIWRWPLKITYTIKWINLIFFCWKKHLVPHFVSKYDYQMRLGITRSQFLLYGNCEWLHVLYCWFKSRMMTQNLKSLFWYIHVHISWLKPLNKEFKFHLWCGKAEEIHIFSEVFICLFTGLLYCHINGLWHGSIGYVHFLNFFPLSVNREWYHYSKAQEVQKQNEALMESYISCYSILSPGMCISEQWSQINETYISLSCLQTANIPFDIMVAIILG